MDVLELVQTCYEKALPDSQAAIKDGMRLLVSYGDVIIKDDLEALILGQEIQNIHLPEVLGIIQNRINFLAHSLGITFMNEPTLLWQIQRLRYLEDIKVNFDKEFEHSELRFASHFAEKFGTHIGTELNFIEDTDKLEEVMKELNRSIDMNKVENGASFVKVFTKFVSVSEKEIVPELKAIADLVDLDYDFFMKIVPFDKYDDVTVTETILLILLLDERTRFLSKDDMIEKYREFIVVIDEERFNYIEMTFRNLLIKYIGGNPWQDKNT